MKKERKMKKVLFPILALVLALSLALPMAAAPVAAATNLVTNGSFETPEMTSGTGWDAYLDGTVPGWSVSWWDYSSIHGGPYPPVGRPTTARIEIHEYPGIPWGAAADGDQWTELDSDWNGPTTGPNGVIGNKVIEPSPAYIYQSIATTADQYYILSFALSNRPDLTNPSYYSRLGVFWGGTGNIIADITKGGAFSWTTYTYIVQATGSSTELGFAELGFPDSYGTLLDDVVLVEINPEIEVTKSADVDMVHHGDTITYTYEVENTGDVDLDPPTVVDNELPITPAYVSGDDSNVGVFDVGEIWVFEATYAVPAHDDEEDDPIVDTATATALFDSTEITADSNVVEVDILHPGPRCVHLHRDQPRRLPASGNPH